MITIELLAGGIEQVNRAFIERPELDGNYPAMVVQYLVSALLIALGHEANDFGFYSDESVKAANAPVRSTKCSWEPALYRDERGDCCMKATVIKRVAASVVCRVTSQSSNVIKSRTRQQYPR